MKLQYTLRLFSRIINLSDTQCQSTKVGRDNQRLNNCLFSCFFVMWYKQSLFLIFLLINYFLLYLRFCTKPAAWYLEALCDFCCFIIFVFNYLYETIKISEIIYSFFYTILWFNTFTYICLLKMLHCSGINCKN